MSHSHVVDLLAMSFSDKVDYFLAPEILIV